MRLQYCLLPLLSLVGSTRAFENPTGSCTSEGEDPLYLKDCDLDFLNKPYWRAFLRSDAEDSTAAIIPRPDGKPLRYGLCDPGVSSEEIIAMLNKYQLCQESVTDVQVVNNMDPADALLITQLLHETLLFRARNSGGDDLYIEPYAYDGDTLAACAILSERDPNHAATAYCGAVGSKCDDNGICSDIGVIPSNADVEAIVPALNELYGISGSANGGGPGTPNAPGDDPRSSAWSHTGWLSTMMAFLFLLVI